MADLSLAPVDCVAERVGLSPAKAGGERSATPFTVGLFCRSTRGRFTGGASERDDDPFCFREAVFVDMTPPDPLRAPDSSCLGGTDEQGRPLTYVARAP